MDPANEIDCRRAPGSASGAHRAHRTGALLVALALALSLAPGCLKTLDIKDLDARVTSIGPVYVDGDDLITIHFSVFDGDDEVVNVLAEHNISGDWQPMNDPGAGSRLLSGDSMLPVVEDEDAQHILVWDSGDLDTSGAFDIRITPDVDDDEDDTRWDTDRAVTYPVTAGSL